MATLSQLITTVGGLLNRTDLSAEISDAARLAISYYDSERLYFNETSATITAVASQEFYNLPSGFLFEDRVNLVLNGTKTEVTKREYSDFDSMASTVNTYTGTPTDYTIYGQQLRVFPIPNQSAVFSVAYVGSLTTLAPAGSNAWTTTAEDLIIGRAGWRVSLLKLHDPEMAQMFKAIEMDAYSNLVSRTEKMISTGQVKPYGIDRR